MTPFTISTRIACDLRGRSYEDAARELQRLTEDAPPDAHVIITFAPKSIPPAPGLNYLRRHGGHVGTVELRCPHGATVTEWWAVLRGDREVLRRAR